MFVRTRMFPLVKYTVSLQESPLFSNPLTSWSHVCLSECVFPAEQWVAEVRVSGADSSAAQTGSWSGAELRPSWADGNSGSSASGVSAVWSTLEKKKKAHMETSETLKICFCVHINNENGTQWEQMLCVAKGLQGRMHTSIKRLSLKNPKVILPVNSPDYIGTVPMETRQDSWELYPVM